MRSLCVGWMNNHPHFNTMVGEIHTPKLGISEGAVFDGRAWMKGDAEPAGVQEGNVRSLIPTKTGVCPG